MNGSILEFDSVSFQYTPDQKVIDNLQLAIPRGKTTAILGANGSGKTTLLHLALGWFKPKQGKIIIDGKPTDSYTRRELGKLIGLLPQNEHIAFEYSILEYVLLGRAPYLHPLEMPGMVDCHQALCALERVGLGVRADQSILKLSGGERQLVLLARALAQEPRIVLMDEPTAHLDLANKIRLVEIIQMLSREGVTVVFSTHEADFAAATATNLVMLQNGQIQESGPLEDVFITEKLSRLYNAPVKVVDIDGQKLISWGPEK